MNYFMSVLFGVLILTGCSLDATIWSGNADSQIPKAALTGFASSTNKQKTTKGYHVETTAGGMGEELVETTEKGYTVYHGVQGNISSQ